MRCNPRKQKPPPYGNSPCAGSFRWEPVSSSEAKNENRQQHLLCWPLRTRANLAFLSLRVACQEVSLDNSTFAIADMLPWIQQSQGFQVPTACSEIFPGSSHPKGCSALIVSSKVPTSLFQARLSLGPTILR